MIYDFNISKDRYLKNIDYLVLCKSNQWVPNQYIPLYELWKDLFA